MAIERLEDLLVHHYELVDPEVVNILAELCIATQAFERVFKVNLMPNILCSSIMDFDDH